MEVTVALYATLIRYNPEGTGNQPFKVQLPEGVTVKELLKHLGIGEGEAKQYFIRHKSQPVDYKLEDGDRVAIFPAIAGG
jgi:sulfur-carrier protein